MKSIRLNLYALYLTRIDFDSIARKEKSFYPRSTVGTLRPELGLAEESNRKDYTGPIDLFNRGKPSTKYQSINP